MKRFTSKNVVRIIIALLSISMLLGVPVWVSAGSPAPKYAGFSFSIDGMKDTLAGDLPNRTSGGSVGIINGVKLTRGADLSVWGWLVTDGGVTGYQYSVDGGIWKDLSGKDCSIYSREDVDKAIKEYPNHGKAGFDLTVRPAELEVGLHDIYFRAVKANGEYCGFLVLLNLEYGNVDKNTKTYTDISFEKYDRECFVKNESTGKTEIRLDSANAVLLGKYNTALYTEAEIEYSTPHGYDSEYPAIGFTLDGTSFGSGKENMPYYATSTAAYSDAITERYEASTVTVDLTGLTLFSNLYLTYNSGSESGITVHRVTLKYKQPDFYKDELFIPVTSSAEKYLSGANQVVAEAGNDNEVGDFSDLVLAQDTNDPYIYFNMERYLKETRGINVNADTYKYIVIRAKSYSDNTAHSFRFFLCAGETMGPTGSQSVAFDLKNDGQWHYYIIDLSTEKFDYWSGQIHGLRFDILEGGTMKQGEHVSVASIELCSTYDDAKAASEKVRELYIDPENIADESMFAEKERSTEPTHINCFTEEFGEAFSGEHQMKVGYGKYADLRLKKTEDGYDPFVSFDLKKYNELNGCAKTLNASDYKCMVLRVLGNKKITGKDFEFFYYTSDHPHAEGGYSVSVPYNKLDEWNYILLDFTNAKSWSGEILGGRLDWCTGGSVGAEMYISDIWLFDTVKTGTEFVAAMTVEETTASEDLETTSEDTTASVIIGEEITKKPTDSQQESDFTSGADDETTPETDSGCQSILTSSALIILGLFLIAVFVFNRKKSLE